MFHFGSLRIGLELGISHGVPPLAEGCREPSRGKATSRPVGRPSHTPARSACSSDIGRVDAEHEGSDSPWFQRLRGFSSPGFLADLASQIEDGRLIRRPSGAQVSRKKLAAARVCKVAGMTQRDSVAKLDLPSSTVQRY